MWLVFGLLSACKTPLTQANASELSAAVEDQYGERRLDEVTWLTAHNAFVNNGDSAWLAPNQGTASIADQLDDGVRALMLDIHSHEGVAKLCHNNCNGIPLISPRQDLGKALNTVVSFLNKHNDAIITIFFEDYSAHDELAAALNDAPGLRDLLFDPYQQNVTSQGWPKVVDMIRSNKRLLIISDHSDKKDLGVGFAQDLTVENYWSMGSLAKDRACRSRWDRIPLNQKDRGFQRLFVMNHFRDVPTPITAAIDNRFSDIWPRLERECVGAAGRRPNYIAVDYYHSASKGATKAVETMNGARGILFKDINYTGATQILLKGSIAVDHMIFGNDTATSILMFPGGGKVKLYREAKFQDFIKEITVSTPYIGDDANDQVSSIIIE